MEHNNKANASTEHEGSTKLH